MKFGAAIVFALILTGSPVSAAVITFETGVAPGYGPGGPAPLGEIVANQYLSSGVVFTTSTDGGGLADLVAFASNSSYGINPGYLGGNFLTATTIPAWGSPGTVTVQFVQPGNASVQGWVNGSAANPLSFYVRDDNGASNPAISVQFIFYDVYGQQIGPTGNLANSGLMANTFSFIDLTGVNRIVFTDMGPDGFVLDTLSFGTVYSDQLAAISSVEAVPEPGTLGLLGAGWPARGRVSPRRRAGSGTMAGHLAGRRLRRFPRRRRLCFWAAC